jgi:hypothetical protein
MVLLMRLKASEDSEREVAYGAVVVHDNVGNVRGLGRRRRHVSSTEWVPAD